MAQMDKNMYRVGDFVYFESSPGAPYLIRRIDELNKMSTGNVEAKVACFYRRREIPKELLYIADKAERKKNHDEEDLKKAVSINIKEESIPPTTSTENDDKKEDEVKVESTSNNDNDSNQEVDDIEQKSADNSEISSSVNEGEKDDIIGLGGLPTGAEKLTKQQIHALRCRELFFTRQCESIPAANIRGKCNVTLLSEVENPEDYLDKEDFFFYSLVYDATNMSLLADKGSLRLGDRYQAVVDPWEGPSSARKVKLEEPMEKDEKPSNILHVPPTTDRETLVYHPHHTLTDKDIDQFLILARAVGTFARAIDPTSSAKYPSVQMTAASASRDVTLLHAMALLHYGDYDIGKAVKYLVPPPDRDAYPIAADKVTSCNTTTLGGPVLCRDQFEEWSPYETNLFEEGMEKLGKDFGEIRQVCLGWKTMKDIIEYYYMWKTTNRYAEIKKKKNEEKDCKLKQVYVPSFSKPSPNLAHSNSNPPKKGTYKCESCERDDGSSYYNWGPSYLSLKICNECWIFWKKCGALKVQHPNELFDLDKNVSSDKNLPLPNFKSCPTIVGGKLTNIPSQIVAKLTPEQLAIYQAHLAASNGSALQNGTKAVMVPSKRASFLWKADILFKLGCKTLTKQQLKINKLSRAPCKTVTGLTQECVINHLKDVIVKNPLIINKIIAGSSWRGSKNLGYQEILQVLAKRGVKRPANEDDDNSKETKKANLNM
uniref:Metastasis-associated protein MTA3 n=1 Tax=Strongyloides papillosus TaxID=174720 RepID=A0A0N5CD90_STREA